MLYKNLPLAGIILLVTACAYNPTANYSGQTASITDSTERISNSKVRYFVVESINGKEIENGIDRGGKVSTGKTNLRQGTITLDRNIPANTPMDIEISGLVLYALGLRSDWNETYEINGTLTFTPQANQQYAVNGELTDSYRALWIENTLTGEVVSDKIEILGSEPA